MKNIKTLVLFFLIITSVFSIYVTSYKVTATKVKDFVSPPPMLEHYSFGLKPQTADLLWVRVIQDFDFCEEHVFKNTCKGQSWLYRMMNTIVELDPFYYIVYRVGGLALTVLISDYEGASRIFDKGVAQFPDDWRLLFNAGYHALYEEQNPHKAADLYKRAALNGGPSWGVSLAERLNTKKGKIEVGERILSQMLERGEDEKIIFRMRERLNEFRAEPE